MKNNMVSSFVFLFLFGCFSSALGKEPTGQKTVDLSAAALGAQVGLEITDILVIGKIEQIRNGEIALATTEPVTLGIVSKPQSVPLSLPQPQRKILQAEEFDAKIFYPVNSRTPHLRDDIIYNNLFKEGGGRYSDTPKLRAVCLLEPPASGKMLLDKPGGKNLTKRAPKSRGETSNRQAKQIHKNRGPVAVKGKGKNGYF